MVTVVQTIMRISKIKTILPPLWLIGKKLLPTHYPKLQMSLTQMVKLRLSPCWVLMPSMEISMFLVQYYFHIILDWLHPTIHKISTMLLNGIEFLWKNLDSILHSLPLLRYPTISSGVDSMKHLELIHSKYTNTQKNMLNPYRMFKTNIY